MHVKTYRDFRRQPIETQAALVWKYGVFLERVFRKDGSFWLYSIYGFYVEMKMTQDEDHVLAVRAFKSPVGLEKYLGNIDWERLLAA
ncbi:MAG TPA: hypothetical protein VEY71_03725 [Chitinophagales bacterium]|nr:hypothetical protein [Chitinophagales bacterium]